MKTFIQNRHVEEGEEFERFQAMAELDRDMRQTNGVVNASDYPILTSTEPSEGPNPLETMDYLRQAGIIL